MHHDQQTGREGRSSSLLRERIRNAGTDAGSSGSGSCDNDGKERKPQTANLTENINEEGGPEVPSSNCNDENTEIKEVGRYSATLSPNQKNLKFQAKLDANSSLDTIDFNASSNSLICISDSDEEVTADMIKKNAKPIKFNKCRSDTSEDVKKGCDGCPEKKFEENEKNNKLTDHQPVDILEEQKFKMLSEEALTDNDDCVIVGESEDLKEASCSSTIKNNNPRKNSSNPQINKNVLVVGNIDNCLNDDSRRPREREKKQGKEIEDRIEIENVWERRKKEHYCEEVQRFSVRRVIAQRREAELSITNDMFQDLIVSLQTLPRNESQSSKKSVTDSKDKERSESKKKGKSLSKTGSQHSDRSPYRRFHSRSRSRSRRRSPSRNRSWSRYRSSRRRSRPRERSRPKERSRPWERSRSWERSWSRRDEIYRSRSPHCSRFLPRSPRREDHHCHSHSQSLNRKLGVRRRRRSHSPSLESFHTSSNNSKFPRYSSSRSRRRSRSCSRSRIPSVRQDKKLSQQQSHQKQKTSTLTVGLDTVERAVSKENVVRSRSPSQCLSHSGIHFSLQNGPISKPQKTADVNIVNEPSETPLRSTNIDEDVIVITPPAQKPIPVVDLADMENKTSTPKVPHTTFCGVALPSKESLCRVGSSLGKEESPHVLAMDSSNFVSPYSEIVPLTKGVDSLECKESVKNQVEPTNLSPQSGKCTAWANKLTEIVLSELKNSPSNYCGLEKPDIEAGNGGSKIDNLIAGGSVEGHSHITDKHRTGKRGKTCPAQVTGNYFNFFIVIGN